MGKTTGDILKQIREHNMMTYEKWAQLLRTSSRNIYRWETNSSVPRRSMLLNILRHASVKDSKALLTSLGLEDIIENNVEDTAESPNQETPSAIVARDTVKVFSARDPYLLEYVINAWLRVDGNDAKVITMSAFGGGTRWGVVIHYRALR